VSKAQVTQADMQGPPAPTWCYALKASGQSQLALFIAQPLQVNAVVCRRQANLPSAPVKLSSL